MITYKCTFKDSKTLKTRTRKITALTWLDALEKGESLMKPDEFILDLQVINR